MEDDLELDLNAFIANIEQSAPQEEIDDKQFRCQECDTVLEEDDGVFVCPNCSAQATNILQLEETEFNYDEMGRAIVGQQVKQGESRPRGYQADYGWTWSTDEAIVHLLNLQITKLEEAKIIPEFFRERVKSMWLKFWIENIAPFIKDVYEENDLKPILSNNKSLKMRDIEVLVKVRDKVMIPQARAIRDDSPKKRVNYRMMGTRFFKLRSSTEQPKFDLKLEDDCENFKNSDLHDMLPSGQSSEVGDYPVKQESVDDEDERMDTSTPVLQSANETNNTSFKGTRNISLDNISILTLNRTLAFIEAVARCTEMDQPIFASDLIRACNYRMIPFYGAHKNLPEHMKLNQNDRKTFVKVRPPSPLQLTRAATLLLTKVYHDKLPTHVPVPSLEKILERFITDMNLPKDMMNYFKMPNFSCFKQTQPIRLDTGSRSNNSKLIPQYDRWAYAILMSHLKRLFSLDNQSILEQDVQAKEETSSSGIRIFSMNDWMRQTSMKLDLILTYDPFVLYHPMANIETLKLTPQVCNYIEDILHDKVSSTTRCKAARLKHDLQFHLEVAEFLKKEIPKPEQVDGYDELELEKPIDILYPIQDAIYRTRRFWELGLFEDKVDVELIDKDFSSHKTVPFEPARTWSIYPIDKNQQVQVSWPECYKLLLSVGGYLCNCEPRELLRELGVVEEYLFPELRVCKKIQVAKIRQSNKRLALGIKDSETSDAI